jgi:alkaline phosphatase
MGSEIAEDALSSGFDILIGNGDRGAFVPNERNGQRDDGRDLTKELEAKGYAAIESEASFRAVPSLPVYGFVPGMWEDTELLARISAEAFHRLAGRPEGFFIMVEGMYCDTGGHSNNPDFSVGGALNVDFVAKAALDFARPRGDTLIVITADHETGGVYWAPNPANPKRPYVGYMTTGHSGVPVDVFAYGPGADRFAGALDNTDIPKVMAALWKLPLSVPASLPADVIGAGRNSEKSAFP